ncbi:MAG: hypothetical protein WCT85_01645 [Parachlamydiales bacterium]|jgi:hypothetical protein
MSLDYQPQENLNSTNFHYALVAATQVNQESKPFNLLSKPTDADYKECALTIVSIFADGFQWNDIAQIMKLSLEYLNHYYSLSAEEKKAGAIAIVNNIIDLTDTPYLPDNIFDPVFKVVMESFIEVIMPSNQSSDIVTAPRSGSITDNDIVDFVKNLKDAFSDGIQAKDLATVTNLSLQFVNQFANTSANEKKQAASNIIGNIIDEIPLTKYVPYSSKILKNLSDGFIDGMLDSIL